MKDGFVKLAAATPTARVADCAYNAAQTVALAKEAAAAGAKLLILPELGLTAYTCGDLFLQTTLQNGAMDALFWVAKETADLPMLLAVGLPLAQGGKLYNCAAMLYRGEILGFVPKRHLPNYQEFYELRHFTPAPAENQVIELHGKRYPFGTNLLFSCRELPMFTVALEICEDLWVACPPSVSHAAAGATILGNLSASDETIGKSEYRRMLVSAHSARTLSAYVYADAGDGESTTDMVFAGHDLIAENGTILTESPLFANRMVCTEVDVEKLTRERSRMNTAERISPEGYTICWFSMPLTDTVLTRPVAKNPFVPSAQTELDARCDTILQMQANGLAKRISHAHAKTAVIGISGGLDSCLALLVAVRAMDRLHRPHTDILAVTMPCFGTTARTRGNAEQLCNLLGVTFSCIPIADAVRVHLRDIAQPEEKQDVTYENAQARERTQVLMDLSNRTGGMVVGTGDLSELALGWATYNGDHMSMYGVNASVPKTLVRHVVRYYAASCKDKALSKVLLDILDTPVSPELLPADGNTILQKTEDLVGPYELHDFFLYYFIRYGMEPKKIYRLARYAFGEEYDCKTILKWLQIFFRRFFIQQFKRSCLPDGPKVGSVTLSPRGDFRMPSDASAQLWLAQIEDLVRNAQ